MILSPRTYGPATCPHCQTEFTRQARNQVICGAEPCRRKQQAKRDAKRDAK